MDYENIYRKLYDMEPIGATEDYKKYFAAEFDPDRFDWTNEDEAKSALVNLLKELYGNYEKLLERFSNSEDTLSGV